MKRFDFVARNGAKLDADYVIENGVLHVAYRGASMSVAAGVNEIANAFLRDNLMRSITGEIEVGPPSDAEVAPSGLPAGP
jgi:hypothetical protein